MTNQNLPADLFVLPEGASPAEAYRKIEAQVGDTFADRTDLLGVLAMQAKAEGQRGWRERVQLLLSEGGHAEVHTKVISDASKMFELFRIGGDQGFGWRREELTRYSVRHLRVFAQNAEWANKNRSRVLEMLATVPTENEMRHIVQAAIRAAKDGTPEVDTEIWESVVLRLSPVTPAPCGCSWPGCGSSANRRWPRSSATSRGWPTARSSWRWPASGITLPRRSVTARAAKWRCRTAPSCKTPS